MDVGACVVTRPVSAHPLEWLLQLAAEQHRSTHTSPPGHCCTYATATTTQPRLNQLGIAEADQENNLGFLDRGDFLPVMSCLRPSRYDVGSGGVGAVGGV